MRLVIAFLLTGLMIGSGACTRRNDEQMREDGRRASQESNTAARKLGRAAYKVAEKTEEAARKAGRELKAASHEAHQGWQEEKQKEKTRAR